MDRRVRKKFVGSLTARYYLRGRPTVHVGLIENHVCPHVCWPGGQHLLLAHDQIGGVETRQFESVAVRDGVRRTGLDAISAENAAVVVDVVYLGIALGAADAVFGRVLGGFDVNAIRRTRRRAQETRDTLFQSILIALQNVRPAETRFQPGSAQGTFAVGIVLHGRGIEHLPEGDAHSLGNRGNVFQDWHVTL
jgi:hypothetical protein